MKQYAHKILALAVMTMLRLPGWSSAQEMIKRIDDRSYFSMARSHRIFKNWVVYDEKVNASIFGWMDTSSLNKKLDVYNVCGLKEENNNPTE